MTQPTHLHLLLPDAEATATLAQAMAATQPLPAVVYLHGDLGAGKSTLARAWLRALGVGGAIRSPTYTLVEPYEFADARRPAGAMALHLDLYRIGDAGELEFLALDDADMALWLVEWPERGRRSLPPADLAVHLALSGAGRSARLAAGTTAGRDWLGQVASKPELRPFSELASQEVAPASG